MALFRSVPVAICILLIFTAGCTGSPGSSSPSGTAPTPASFSAQPTESPSVMLKDTCQDTVCSAFPQSPAAKDVALFIIETTPNRYSPVMSSTPGIRLTLNRSQNPVGETEYVWNASYGRFLSWDPPDYTVHLLGNEEVTGAETLYWTFTDSPGPAKEPVRITVTARDALTGTATGSAAVTLDWDGETTVIVRESR